MKTKLTLTLFGILALISGSLYAQTNDALTVSEGVKILPTSKSGVIKVMHAFASESNVSIKFITRDGEVGSDQIAKNSYDKGFTKKYDVSKINGADFWIEVKSAEGSVTYHIVPTKNKKTFDAYLEGISYNHVIASNN